MSTAFFGEPAAAAGRGAKAAAAVSAAASRNVRRSTDLMPVLGARLPGLLAHDTHAALAEARLGVALGAQEALRLGVVAVLELRRVEADVDVAGVVELDVVVVPAVHVQARLLAAGGHGR